MTAPFKISLVTSTYNRPDALEAVLLACMAQDDVNFELIVADDGSTEATRLLVERMAAGWSGRMIHVWQADDGFRLSRVRNQGVLASSGEYVAGSSTRPPLPSQGRRLPPSTCSSASAARPTAPRASRRPAAASASDALRLDPHRHRQAVAVAVRLQHLGQRATAPSPASNSRAGAVMHARGQRQVEHFSAVMRRPPLKRSSDTLPTTSRNSSSLKMFLFASNTSL
jgi:hypothetical protein